MNNKIKIILGGLVIVLISFYGGMKYEQNKIPERGNFTAFVGGVGGQRGTNANGRGGGSGIVSGSIISKDSTGVTIKMRDGSSKIVFVSPSTSIMKFVLGNISDLLVGEQVNTSGTSNPDGSVTAQSIQIRQATTTNQ